MDPILDIRFKNGRQSLRDPTTYATSEPFGFNVMSELDLRWDDISEGLILEISTQIPEPDEMPEFGKAIEEADERGALCNISGAAYIHILEAEEMKEVSRIKYKDEVMVKAMGGELVVLAKLGELCATYLGDTEITYDAINALYPVLARKHSRELGLGTEARLDLDRLIALDMGISEKVLYDAREYAYLKAALERDKDKSGDGEWEEGDADEAELSDGAEK